MTLNVQSERGGVEIEKNADIKIFDSSKMMPENDENGHITSRVFS